MQCPKAETMELFDRFDRLFHEDIPEKNTFIHYDIPLSPDVQPAVPTNSAPGILLRRLFKTKVDDVAAPVDQKTATSSSALLDLPRHRLSSTSVVSGTCSKPFSEHDSDASTSTGSEPASPDAPCKDTEVAACAASEEMMQRHSLGNCTPCNYFWYKVDGCRQGGQCSFCHLCPKGEIRKRKKDKLKQLRRSGILSRRSSEKW
jgi:hypothetical protein